MGVSLFLGKQVTGQVEMASSCARGGLNWIARKISSPKGGCEELKQTAQGSNGATIPGGI